MSLALQSRNAIGSLDMPMSLFESESLVTTVVTPSSLFFLLLNLAILDCHLTWMEVSRSLDDGSE
jgi:hypothetical protein